MFKLNRLKWPNVIEPLPPTLHDICDSSPLQLLFSVVGTTAVVLNTRIILCGCKSSTGYIFIWNCGDLETATIPPVLHQSQSNRNPPLSSFMTLGI